MTQEGYMHVVAMRRQGMSSTAWWASTSTPTTAHLDNDNDLDDLVHLDDHDHYRVHPFIATSTGEVYNDPNPGARCDLTFTLVGGAPGVTNQYLVCFTSPDGVRFKTNGILTSTAPISVRGLNVGWTVDSASAYSSSIPPVSID